MSRHDNYPSDIRQYDNDPRSPFYDNSREEALEDARDAIADRWMREYRETGAIAWFSGDPKVEAREGETLGAVLDRFAMEEAEKQTPDFDPLSITWD